MYKQEVVGRATHLQTAISTDPVTKVDGQFNSVLAVIFIDGIVEGHVVGKLYQIP